MKKVMTIIFAVFIFLSAQSQKVNELINSGNNFYKQQEFTKAVAEYVKALEIDPSNVTAKFNQANALYKQNKKVEAAKLFSEVIKSETDKELLSKTYYNKGVILSQQKNLEESIEAYKNSLRNSPADKDARENLQKALLELKKKETPKKKDDQQKKKDQQQQKQQSKMSLKEAEQRLKLMQQKEKEVQQRVQKEKARPGGSQTKDW